MTSRKKTVIKNPITRRKVGRPSCYKDAYADQVRKLCLLGLTDTELADFFGVAESTLNLWKKKYPEFSESLWRGKQIADAEVALSLFQRACGYEHPEVHISCYQGEIIETKLTKRYPPDTGAATLWLKNRQPLKWRDRVDVNHGGQIDNPLMILARAVQGAALPVKD